MSPPQTVYFVERIPHEEETIPYYGRKLNRFYQQPQGVKQFIKGNSGHIRPGGGFKVYKIEVEAWEDITGEFWSE